MKQAASRPQATNGHMSWPKRERVVAPSNLSCTTRTRQLSKQAKASSAHWELHGGERWLGREGRAMKTINTDSGASSHAEAQWRAMGASEACCKNAGDGAARPNWHAQNAWEILQRRWESRQGPSVISWLRWAASCGAAGVELEQPRSQSFLASRVWSNRGLKTMREAYAGYRVAGIPRKTVSLDHRTCSQSKHG